MALIVAFGNIKLSLNQVAVGFVLFALCTELSRFLGQSYVGRPPVAVPAWEIPGLSSIPFFGRVLFDHNLIVYLAYVTVIATYLFMYRTRRGLELQGIGERPEAAHSRGVPVNRLRYLYTALGGALIGIGGAAYSLDIKLGWSDRPTRNLGWIVLAIVIFGGWHPLRAAIGVLLFGALQAYAINLHPRVPQPVPGAAEHSLPGHDSRSGHRQLEGVVEVARPLPILESDPAERSAIRHRDAVRGQLICALRRSIEVAGRRSPVTGPRRRSEWFPLPLREGYGEGRSRRENGDESAGGSRRTKQAGLRPTPPPQAMVGHLHSLEGGRSLRSPLLERVGVCLSVFRCRFPGVMVLRPGRPLAKRTVMT